MRKSWLAWMVVSLLFHGEAQAAVKSGGGVVGEFKGYVAINDLLKVRLLDPADRRTRSFELSRYFGEYFPSAGGLSTLLGAFSGEGGANAFRNGVPNGVNMLLWTIGFTALGKQISTVCDVGGAARLPFKPNDLVLAELEALCVEGVDAEAKRERLAALWLNLLSFDLPEAEFQAFVAFFSTDPVVAAMPAKDQVAVAFTALFLNPLVLLEN